MVFFLSVSSLFVICSLLLSSFSYPCHRFTHPSIYPIHPSVRLFIHQPTFLIRSAPKGGSLNVRDLRVQWEQLPVKGNAPSTRSSMSVAVHKNRAVCFGGVMDEDGKDDLTSRFFNDIHAFDMDKKRWFELKLRSKDKSKGKRRKNKKKKKKRDVDESAGQDDDDEEEEEDEDEDDEENNHHDALGYDDLEDDKFYYIVDGELVEMEMDSEDEDEGENQGGDEGEEKGIAEGEQQSAADDATKEKERLRKEDEKALAAAEAKAEAEEQAAREAAAQEAERELAEAAAEAEAAKVLEMLRLEARENAKVTPRPRMGAGLAVRSHSLYVFGGAFVSRE